MSVGLCRVGANRPLGVATAHRIKAIPAPLEGIGIALYLFGDVGDRPGGLPVRLVAHRVGGKGRLVVTQLKVRMHQAGTVAQGDVIDRILRDQRKNDGEHARMIVPPLIERKRDGRHLSPEEWSAIVAEYTAGRIPDYQIAALLMAVFMRGLDRQELAALTDPMPASGGRLSFDSWGTTPTHQRS